MPELRNAEQVVEKLGLPIKASTLKRWAREGRVPATRVSHKTLLFDVATVAKVLNGQPVEAGENT